MYAHDFGFYGPLLILLALLFAFSDANSQSELILFIKALELDTLDNKLE